MPSSNSSPRSLSWAIALALGFGLAACSQKPAPTAPAAPAAASANAAAEAAANQAAQQQAAALAALSADELRTRGRQALREQRIYTPAGNNAMEYYIALRKKSAKPDASAESALMDLQPYAVIAAEQALGREDFIEAERLRSLIAAADPQAPSLARIADAIAKGKAAAAQRATQEATKTADQAAATEAARLKAIQDAKDLQASAAAAASRPAPSAPTPAAAAPPPTTTTAAAPPPRPTPAAPTPAAPRAPSELVAIATPPPEFPSAAQRRGVGGSVVVTFTVNPDGSTGDITIVSATPRGVFDRSVESAVRRWKFRPIGDPQKVTRTINFAAPQ
jgi:protein TonB